MPPRLQRAMPMNPLFQATLQLRLDHRWASTALQTDLLVSLFVFPFMYSLYIILTGFIASGQSSTGEIIKISDVDVSDLFLDILSHRYQY